MKFNWRRVVLALADDTPTDLPAPLLPGTNGGEPAPDASTALTNAYVDFVANLLADPDWVSRRVETVIVRSRAIRERRVSVDINVSELQRRMDESGCSRGSRIPVAILPKGLIFEFDARDGDGNAISVGGRADDSELAAALLLRLGPPQPSEAMREFLLLLSFEFALPGLSRVLAQEHPRAICLGLSRLLDFHLNHADREWWVAAWSREEFRSYVRMFARNFLILVDVPLNRPSSIVKVRRLEPASDSAPSIDDPPQGQAADFALRFSDLGRAASEHLRVIAPEGTFFTDPLMIPEGPGEVEYSERVVEDRIVMYARDAEPGSHVLLAQLWPKRSGFMRPAKFLSGYGSFVLTTGALAEYFGQARWGPAEGLLTQLTGAPSVAATLLITLPSVLIAYVVRDGEHDLRVRLLRRWRTTALGSLFPLWTAAVSLLLPRNHLPPWLLWSWWGSAALLAVALHVAIQVQDFRVRRAWRNVSESSGETRTRYVRVAGSL